jgi:hypothetical protein
MEEGLMEQTRSLTEWGRLIDEAAGRTVEGLLQMGSYLAAARAQHPYKFRPWLEQDGCCINRITAYRLILVHNRLSVSHGIHIPRGALPPVIGTLYELSKMDRVELEAAIDTKLVHPDMTRDEAHKIVSLLERKPDPRLGGTNLEQAVREVRAGAKIIDVARARGIPKSTLGQAYARTQSIGSTRTLRQQHHDRQKLTRFVRETMNTVDALVLSIDMLDFQASTALDPTTWPWLDRITESLQTITRFTKELNRARTRQQAAEDHPQGTSALGSDLSDASEPGCPTQLPGESRSGVCEQA